MTPRPLYVSVVDPVGPALEHVKTVLFRPFDLGKWFVIGFCAWLALLGKGGGGGGGGGGVPDGGGGGAGRGADFPDQVRDVAEQAKEYVLNNLEWLLPLVIGVFVFVIGLWLVIIWLSSRGRFMFLHCVAQNKAEVVNPWHQFRRHANSLFGFRIVVGLITLFAALAFLVLIGVVIFFAVTSAGFNFLTIAGIVCCGLLFFATSIVSAVIAKFTNDFAVPIMYRHTPSAVAAWHVLLDVLAFNKARFFLYLLFQIVIGVAVFGLIVAAGCLTCCCGFCLMAIPYIGTVILLPILVFERAYPLYYLAQYGPELNVFPAPPAATVPPPVPGA